MSISLEGLRSPADTPSWLERAVDSRRRTR